MVDDFELLKRWAAGDKAAGGQLYDRHVSKVQRFFRNRVQDGVDDLVQATFLASLEASDRFRGDSKFTTYLYSIARFKLLEHMRRRRSKHDVIDPLVVSVMDCGHSPTSVIVRNEREQILQAAMCRLPIDMQIALELYYWEGVTARELAEILSLPEGTVRTRLRRARQQLRKYVEAAGVRGVLPGQT